MRFSSVYLVRSIIVTFGVLLVSTSTLKAQAREDEHIGISSALTLLQTQVLSGNASAASQTLTRILKLAPPTDNGFKLLLPSQADETTETFQVIRRTIRIAGSVIASEPVLRTQYLKWVNKTASQHRDVQRANKQEFLAMISSWTATPSAYANGRVNMCEQIFSTPETL